MNQKIYNLSTWLHMYGQANPNCTTNDVYTRIGKLVFSRESVTTLTSVTEEEAKVIARESNLEHLDRRRLELAILGAFHSQGIPKEVLIRQAVNRGRIETDEERRCCHCGKWKPHTAFSETSRMCRRCKKLADSIRRPTQTTWN